MRVCGDGRWRALYVKDVVFESLEIGEFCFVLRTVFTFVYQIFDLIVQILTRYECV